MAVRPSGDLVEEERKTGAERGDPITPSDLTTDIMAPVDVVGAQSTAAAANPAHNLSTGSQDLAEAEREKDGALGVSGGQPDVSPSGPSSNNELPEPKVKLLVKLGTRHKLRAFVSYIHFRVKSDFSNENKFIYNSPC